jgi:hypothetical protein
MLNLLSIALVGGYEFSLPIDVAGPTGKLSPQDVCANAVVIVFSSDLIFE